MLGGDILWLSVEQIIRDIERLLFVALMAYSMRGLPAKGARFLSGTDLDPPRAGINPQISFSSSLIDIQLFNSEEIGLRSIRLFIRHKYFIFQL